MRLLHWNITLAAALCASRLVMAQGAPAAILEVQVENYVQYVGDVSDATRFATDPRITAAPAARTFGTILVIGDIVSVNGTPAKGAAIISQRTINLRTSPTPGQAASDVVRNAISDYALEVLQPNGTPIGSIYASGFSGGPAGPPGAPLAVRTSNNAVVGGTGAFLGVRGQLGGGAATSRNASVTEDPINRRANGGGRLTILVHVIPMFRPEVATITISSSPLRLPAISISAPAVFHADFSPVTAAYRAKAGEVLIAQATGLGPTLPGVNPGQPFPTDAVQRVNSPFAVTVNGQDAEVLNSVGWPGLVDTYRVDFRVPYGVTAGLAVLQLSAAWIAGPSVNVPVW